MYCVNCEAMVSSPACPHCGSRDLRSPRPCDPCFLCEKELLWSGMLEDVLRQEKIPYYARNALGAGVMIKAGPLMETVRFYVPYSQLAQAQALVDELFSAPDLDEDT